VRKAFTAMRLFQHPAFLCQGRLFRLPRECGAIERERRPAFIRLQLRKLFPIDR